ncbi:MAG: VCBS repeat-containing protein [Puniceicoccales bacterium]|nr:VCBS repeat-containing protein [Puniceicoccales bacterium]
MNITPPSGRLAVSCFGVFALINAALAATPPPPPTAPHLGAPLVTKLDWGIRSLTIADIDGDGRNDVAILNNDTGRIELLYQRQPGEPLGGKRPARRDRWTPELEDALFRRESFAGDAAMLALAVGDLNGDGLPDIVFTSERNGLNVVFQGPKKGEWREPLKDKRHTATPRADSLRIVKLDGTGKPAIVQLAKEGVALWRFDGTDTTRLPEPQLYRTDGTSGGLVVQKLLPAPNGTAPDIGTLTSNGDDATLRFRRAVSATAYGPELTVRVPASVVSLRTRLRDGTFPALNIRQRIVNTFNLLPDERPLDGAESAVLQTYAPPNGIGGPAQTALADVDGDGTGDLIVADAKAAQLLVYRGLPNGDFADPVEYPSLSGISALAFVRTTDAKKDAPPTLLVLSEKENILGAVTFDGGKPSFPVPVVFSGKPLLLASQEGFAVALVRDEKEKEKLRIQRIQRDGTGAWSFDTLADVEASRRDITALKIADINSDGLPDVLAFVDRESMRLWTQDKEGKLQEAAKDSAYRKSILDSVTPADIGWGVVDDTGKPALLVATQGYIRALRLDDKGELTVVFQANSSRSGDRLRTPLAGKFSQTGDVTVLLAYNETGKTLEWLERDAAGVFRTRQNIALDAFSPLDVWVQSVPSEKTPRLLYLTKERLVQLPTARRGLRVELKKIYETDLQGFTPVLGTAGNFDDKDGAGGIVLLDLRSHILEIIQAGADGKWASALHFTLFDENPHYRGRRSGEAQPREVRVADLTGDGQADLVLLMHDRIFVYPRQKQPK